MTKEEMEIETLQKEIVELKEKLKQKEQRLHELRFRKNTPNRYSQQLSAEEVSRYSRQMLIENIGVTGQLLLKRSKILIVGAGGLGCPAALYLSAAGVGEITLMDSDEVDLTNLHRQILHSESDVGSPKVHSAFNTLMSVNSNVKIIPLHMHANGTTLSDLLKRNDYNVVVDGTDNVATRYLLNDLCVIHGIPLVSGSALLLEGQLTVYNYKNGPCFRCLHPQPPPPYSVATCGDAGVLGVVPGLIGILEALEAIKIITGQLHVLAGHLLVFSGQETRFLNVRLRDKNPDCVVCGDSPTITGPIDYEEFCGAKAHDKIENINILSHEDNMDVIEFAQAIQDNKNVILDVRPFVEYHMCHIPNSINIPYSNILQDCIEDLEVKIKEKCFNGKCNVLVICRRGNDSQRAVCKLKDRLCNLSANFINVKGGLHAYSKLIDAEFAVY